ncbi:MAG: alpha/beta hydrolase [Bacteroidota bacterium]
MPYHKYLDKKIFYKVSGEGPCIVLIHGFTESLNIWNHFAKVLSKEFRVVTIDLPGHGQSETISTVHTMDLLAEILHEILAMLKVESCLMVGHSMGGYIALAYGRKYEYQLSGLVLFHSHCFADSEQDMKNRDRTIRVVEQDKFSFMAQFIPALFPEESREKFKSEIVELIADSESMTREGTIAALAGMKIRQDHSEFLKLTKLKVLFILGLVDSKAPVDRFWEMISLPEYAEVLLLKNVGHMGYIEAKEGTLLAIHHFGLKCLALNLRIR